MKRGDIWKKSLIFGATAILLNAIFIFLYSTLEGILGKSHLSTVAFFYLALVLLWPYYIALMTKCIPIILFGILAQIFYFFSLGYFVSRFDKKQHKKKLNKKLRKKKH